MVSRRDAEVAEKEKVFSQRFPFLCVKSVCLYVSISFFYEGVGVKLYKLILFCCDRSHLAFCDVKFYSKYSVLDIVVLHQPFTIVHVIKSSGKVWFNSEIYFQLIACLADRDVAIQ